MGVQIGTLEYDGFGDFALVSPDVAWGFGDFDVNDWDSIPDLDTDFFGDVGCGCGLAAAKGADKPAVTPAGNKKFPWGAVVGGAIGLGVGIGVAVLARRLLRR